MSDSLTVYTAINSKHGDLERIVLALNETQRFFANLAEVNGMDKVLTDTPEEALAIYEGLQRNVNKNVSFDQSPGRLVKVTFELVQE